MDRLISTSDIPIFQYIPTSKQNIMHILQKISIKIK